MSASSRAALRRGEDLGLTEEELAFNEALETNDNAVQVLSDGQLRMIARELVKTVRANVTIRWTVRENVRANLQVQAPASARGGMGIRPKAERRRREMRLARAELWGTVPCSQLSRTRVW